MDKEKALKPVIPMNLAKKKLANSVALREVLCSYRRSEWMNQVLKSIQISQRYNFNKGRN
jgi:hypothetical protein